MNFVKKTKIVLGFVIFLSINLVSAAVMHIPQVPLPGQVLEYCPCVREWNGAILNDPKIVYLIKSEIERALTDEDFECIKRIIKENGIDFRLPPMNMTIMHYAVLHENLNHVELFVEYLGCKLDVVDSLGRMPIDWARPNGKIFNYLMYKYINAGIYLDHLLLLACDGSNENFVKILTNPPYNVTITKEMLELAKDPLARGAAYVDYRHRMKLAEYLNRKYQEQLGFLRGWCDIL